jgi:hypothetical protein
LARPRRQRDVGLVDPWTPASGLCSASEGGDIDHDDMRAQLRCVRPRFDSHHGGSFVPQLVLWYPDLNPAEGAMTPLHLHPCVPISRDAVHNAVHALVLERQEHVKVAS